MVTPTFATNDLELLEELQAGAEARLAAQLDAALAADQRALVFAGFVAAAAVALASGGVTSLLSQGGDVWVGMLALVACLGMSISMAYAVQAARPTDWYFPGVRPSSWLSDISASKPRLQRLQELAADYDTRITENDATMRANGKLLRASNLIALGTLVTSVLLLSVYVAVFRSAEKTTAAATTVITNVRTERLPPPVLPKRLEQTSMPRPASSM